MVYLIINLAVAALILMQDFRKEPQHHRKAKVIQAFTVCFFCICLPAPIENIVALFYDFDSGMGAYARSAGIIPASINQLLYYLQQLFFLTLLACTMLLAARKNVARVWLMSLLPFWVFFYALNFYRNATLQAQETAQTHYLQLLPGIVFFSAVALIFWKLYAGKVMKQYFNA